MQRRFVPVAKGASLGGTDFPGDRASDSRARIHRFLSAEQLTAFLFFNDVVCYQLEQAFDVLVPAEMLYCIIKALPAV